MTSAIRSRFARPLAVGALVAGAATLLVGCTGATKAPATPSPKPLASATKAAGPQLGSTAFSAACDSLAAEATVAAAYPGMQSASPDPEPAGDAGIVKDNGGTVCTWKSTEGKSITLAVGQFDTASLTEVKNGLVTSSNSVPTYGVEGYFLLAGTDEAPIGVAEAFSDPYWIVATSDAFLEPGDAQPLVAAVVASLEAIG